MYKKLAQKAVKAAMSGDWQNAIQLNNQILQDTSDDIDALNRLANAHAAIGELDEAMKTAKKVLKIEPTNSIAQRSVKKWENSDGDHKINSEPVNPSEFIEETGKTKLIPLINLGDDSVIAQLSPADKVILKPHNHKVCVYARNQKYIGRLPDDVAAKIKKLMEYGNEYTTYIKTVDKNSVKVFVRETKRCEELKNIPSFSSEKIDFISFKK